MNHYTEHALKTEISRLERFLAPLESGQILIGDGGTGAQIHYFKRQIRMYQSILNRRKRQAGYS
jgi:hypothetical protein